jgi:hypothetical protein
MLIRHSMQARADLGLKKNGTRVALLEPVHLHRSTPPTDAPGQAAETVYTALAGMAEIEQGTWGCTFMFSLSILQLHGGTGLRGLARYCSRSHSE